MDYLEIYLITVSVTTILLLYHSKLNGIARKSRNSKYIFLLLILFLVVLQGARSVTVGGDLFDNYADLYNESGGVRFDSIISYSAFRGYEWGYIFFNKLVYILSGGSLFAFLISISVCYIGSILYMISKYSKNRFYSVFIFITLYLFNVSMNNLRSTLALSIIYFAFAWLIEKKNIKFILAVLLATTIHQTALIFIPLIAINSIENKTKLFICCFTTLISINLLYQLMERIVSNYFEKYLTYFDFGNQGGYTLLGFLLFMSLIITLLGNKNFWKYSYNNALYKILLYACILQLISLKVPHFSRAVYYFMNCLIILIPNLINDNRLSQYSKIVLHIVVIVLFWLYYVIMLNADPAKTVPYTFSFL